jgi:hypothetical protein
VLVHGAWVDGSGWKPVYEIAGPDQIINPNLERMYAGRAHSHVVEVPGAGHSVYESDPREIAALIEDAAMHAQVRPAS